MLNKLENLVGKLKLNRTELHKCVTVREVAQKETEYKISGARYLLDVVSVYT